VNWGPYLDGLGILAGLFVGLSLAVFLTDMVWDKFNGRRK
jgi:hypothetical protein